jgi:hypothetical protein
MNQFDEKLTKFYTLKNNYLENIEKLKTQLFDKQNLSRKEKHKLFLEKKPKCINCNRNVGTIFEINSNELTKTLKAICGDTTDPCPLHLELKLGYYLLYNQDFKNATEKINKLKLEIILLKNNLLFHYGNKINLMKKFNELKEDLTSEIELYEFTLSQYHKFLNLKEKESIHNQLLLDIQSAVEFLQTKCKEYDIHPTHSLLEEIVTIYIQQILPLIEEKHQNNYHLIKTIYTIENIEMIVETPEIIHWVEGMPAKQKIIKETGETKPKPKPKKQKTVKILTEEQLAKPIKPKKVVKKKIGTIQLQDEEAKGEAEEEKIEEKIEEIKEEKRRIQIMEENNDIIYEGGVIYPNDYFEQDGGDPDDEDDIEPLQIGGLFDGNLDAQEI